MTKDQLRINKVAKVNKTKKKEEVLHKRNIDKQLEKNNK